MNKLIVLSVIVLMASGCKNKTFEYTTLGDYTPYNRYPEKITGKIKKLVENNYWATPNGETFVKGNKITIRDRDSLSWTNDFTALFDIKGRLMSCTLVDENDRPISRWELSGYDNNQTIAKYFKDDTVRSYRKLKFDEKGNLEEILQYRPGSDTLLSRCSVKASLKSDTIELWWYTNKDVPTAKHFFMWDGNGQFLRTEAYDHEGVFRAAVEAKYNDKMKVSELIFSDRDKKIIREYYFTYEYDGKGNWTKALVKNQQGKAIIEERTYSYFE